MSLIYGANYHIHIEAEAAASKVKSYILRNGYRNKLIRNIKI